MQVQRECTDGNSQNIPAKFHTQLYTPQLCTIMYPFLQNIPRTNYIITCVTFLRKYGEIIFTKYS